MAAAGSRSNRCGASGLRVQARSRSGRRQQSCADDPTAHLSHITRPVDNGILNGHVVVDVSRHAPGNPTRRLHVREPPAGPGVITVRPLPSAGYVFAQSVPPETPEDKDAWQEGAQNRGESSTFLRPSFHYFPTSRPLLLRDERLIEQRSVKSRSGLPIDRVSVERRDIDALERREEHHQKHRAGCKECQRRRSDQHGDEA